MGPSLLPAHESNRWGFYEDRALVKLNDRYLQDAAPFSDWLHPTTPTPNGANVAAAHNYITARSHLADAGQWGMKDPRLSITWPIWAAAFQRRPELEVIMVYSSRTDTAIADSLAARDGIPHADALDWAHTYRDAALTHMAGR